MRKTPPPKKTLPPAPIDVDALTGVKGGAKEDVLDDLHMEVEDIDF